MSLNCKAPPLGLEQLQGGIAMGNLKTRAAASLAGLLLSAGLAFGQGTALSAAADAALAARGEYLAKAADCMPCHTGDKAQPFAGGLALNTPFGTIYSPNITSDSDSGIGDWTYEQFVAAVRDGIRADGAYLYPAMPFDAYTLISDDDMKALWAYISRLPPAGNVPPENTLSFPFNVRLGLLAWRELFFDPERFAATPGKSADWNRGAYLATALGHCTDCHTPRNVMGATKGKDRFLGAEIDGYWAPAITTAALKQNGWTADSLAAFLAGGAATGKTTVFGPMAEVVHDSLGFLTAADMTALVTYLLDAPAPADRPAPALRSPLAPEVHARAAALYIDNCIACHRDGGVGEGIAVPPLKGNPAVVASEPYDVIMVVLGGVPAGGTYGAMPSFAGRLSDRQVADLANYVRTSWGNAGTADVTSGMVAAWRATAHVPDYGTQAASAFSCPEVGGAPGADGPDPKAVAAFTAMMAGGQRSIPMLLDAYKGDDSDAGPDDMVDALTAAYCPVVARSDAPDWQKYAELARFTLQAAADVSRRAKSGPVDGHPIIWAVPAGRSLVMVEPRALSTAPACPADDGTSVPKVLGAAATALVGTPRPPVAGDAASGLAETLWGQNPKAKSADVANALILAYCRVVAAQPGASIAEQNGWLNDFGQQVIRTFQLMPARKAAQK